ncbi:MAG: DUF2807 domain-containing protein [Cyclobacteriaceae bacterium]|nr:MAG: DUF2807 domain-containing protein [Cyclobacteriaceae bacterium]
MIRILLKCPLTGVFVLYLTCSCSLGIDSRDCLVGEGAVVSENRPLSGNFTAVQHAIPGDLYITQGSPASLTLEGQQNLLPSLTTTIDNGILNLSFRECLESATPFNARLTMPELTEASLLGSGNILFVNDVQSEHLQIAIVGQGNLDLRGEADTLKINLTGQGNALAFNLTSQVCEVNIQGQGDVSVTANLSLDVFIDGQGNVSYKGMPEITSMIRGQGTIIDAN